MLLENVLFLTWTNCNQAPIIWKQDGQIAQCIGLCVDLDRDYSGHEDYLNSWSERDSLNKKQNKQTKNKKGKKERELTAGILEREKKKQIKNTQKVNRTLFNRFNRTEQDRMQIFEGIHFFKATINWTNK